MKRIAYIHLEEYEDEDGNAHYMSRAEGNSVDLTLLLAYLYHDQRELVETAMQEELQNSIKEDINLIN